jgi:hypothetical protein
MNSAWSPVPKLREVHRAVLVGTPTQPAGRTERGSALVPHVVGIRTGLIVPLILPADLTEPEAGQLAEYIRSVAAPPGRSDQEGGSRTMSPRLRAG